MRVFVYGTLVDPDRAAAVLREFSYVGDATLRGFHRVEGRYPTLAPGGSVDGRLLRTGDVAALDDYEGTDRELYVRVGVPLADGATDGGGANGGDADRVQVYVGDPDALGVEGVQWPGTGSLAARVERYVREHDVTVRVA